MGRLIVFTGVLSTSESIPTPDEEISYEVRLGGVDFVPYVADQFPYGGYVVMSLRDMENGHHPYTCQGDLSVFIVKEYSECYKNGWRRSRKQNTINRGVLLGGRPLSARIAAFFKHDIKRFYYERGVHEITIAER